MKKFALFFAAILMTSVVLLACSRYYMYYKNNIYCYKINFFEFTEKSKPLEIPVNQVDNVCNALPKNPKESEFLEGLRLPSDSIAIHTFDIPQPQTSFAYTLPKKHLITIDLIENKAFYMGEIGVSGFYRQDNYLYLKKEFKEKLYRINLLDLTVEEKEWSTRK